MELGHFTWSWHMIALSVQRSAEVVVMTVISHSISSDMKICLPSRGLEGYLPGLNVDIFLSIDVDSY